MSKQQKQPQGQVIKPAITMHISKDQFTQQIMNSKRRISAAKGEFGDNLNDIITRELGGISMIANQIIDQVDDLEVRVKDMELKLKSAGIDPNSEAKLKTPKTS